MPKSRNRHPAHRKPVARRKPVIHLTEDAPLTPSLAKVFTGTHTFKDVVKGISTDTGEVTLTVTRELAEQAIIYGWTLPQLFAEAARCQFPEAKDIEVMNAVPPSRRST